MQNLLHAEEMLGRIFLDLGSENGDNLEPKLEHNDDEFKSSRNENDGKTNAKILLLDVSATLLQRKSFEKMMRNEAYIGRSVHVDFCSILIDFGSHVG